MVEENNENEMSFLQHLEVLRWHLIRSFIALVTASIVAFLNKRILFDNLIFGPKREDFLTYKVLCKLSDWLSQNVSFVSEDLLCIGKNLPVLQNLVMAGQFMTHIKISLIAGLIVAFPYVTWEIWRFIKPGLKSSESNSTKGAVFFITLLFSFGVLFGYYIVSPLSINFFSSYSISDQINNQFTLNTYITTVTTVVLACGILFELPIFVYFLAKSGIISIESLKAYRRHAFVGSLILSAIITPPDIFSQVLVTGPLVILYELSIIIAKRTIKDEE